jgi:hypothetical protein
MIDITNKSIEELQADLNRLIDEYALIANEYIAALNLQLQRMVAFERMKLSYAGNILNNDDLILALIRTEEGKEAIDLLRIADRDVKGTGYAVNVKYLEVSGYIELLKLLIGGSVGI